MKISVELPVAQPDAIQTCALAIEDAGFDACFVTDHPAPSREWMAHGGHQTLDPFVALSFAASATTKLKLHTNCLVPAYREPLASAKAIATLDAMSRGRLILGVAVGYLEAEFEALGVPFARRAERFDETLATMKTVWADLLPNNVVLPKPAQQPHPPIWVGGNTGAAMRRVVQFGNGWSPFPASRGMAAAVDTAAIADVVSLSYAIQRLKTMMREAGRKDDLDICFTPFGHPGHKNVVDPDGFAIEARDLAEAGVTWLAFHLPAPTVNDFCDVVREFGVAIAGRMP